MTGVTYVLLQQIYIDNDGCNLRFTTINMYW